MLIARVPEVLFEALAYASNAFLLVMVLLLWGYLGDALPVAPEMVIQAAAVFGGLGALGVWAGRRLRMRREKEDWIVETDLRLASADVVRAVRNTEAATHPQVARALRSYEEARELERAWRRGQQVPSHRVVPKGELED
ncbi:hypothetical protein HUS23_08440 [Ectothiorhodospiraceae bacterium 2226]|nr:hypothetical protein HUS23_08440 [Ectothiorhodospiraceae bacterium 2226]